MTTTHKSKPQEGVAETSMGAVMWSVAERTMKDTRLDPSQHGISDPNIILTVQAKGMKMKKPDDEWLRAATNGQSGAAAARVEWGDSEMAHPDIVAEQRGMNNAMREAVCGIGISDITARVDASQTPVNVANDAFGACMIRVAMLDGQLEAEKDRLCELAAQLKQATDEAVKKVRK